MSRAVYYFGCWGQVGHFLWTPAAQSAGSIRHPWGVGSRGLDGTLAPGHRDPRRPDHVDSDDQVEGRAALVHRDDWSALAFWDRSVDERLGSNSVFLFSGTLWGLEFWEAERNSRIAFPGIWARFKFEVRLAS